MLPVPRVVWRLLHGWHWWLVVLVLSSFVPCRAVPLAVGTRWYGVPVVPGAVGSGLPVGFVLGRVGLAGARLSLLWLSGCRWCW